MNPILLAVLIVTVIGLIGAVILVAASIFMYVPVDERVEQITGCLPGANCGACGCAGCADYAKTIVEDGNAVNKCVPGGAKVAGEIAAIMGVEAGASVPMKAVVSCSCLLYTSEKGKLVLGIGLGVITCLIRFFGSMNEGVSFAILLMNLLVPYIEVLTRQDLLGISKPKKNKGGAAK